MQVHPLLRLVVSQPHLFAEHAEAYAALASEEMKKVSSAWAVRIGLVAGAGVLAMLGLIWGGVSLLIAAALPSDDYPAGWALWVVPLTPIVVAAVLILIAKGKTMDRPFDVLRTQLRDDMAVVHEAGAP